jgi:hypothetical protein
LFFRFGLGSSQDRGVRDSDSVARSVDDGRLPLPGGGLKDIRYLLLTVPAIGLLTGLVVLNHGFKTKRLVAKSMSSS